jgi:hypothetical protein
MAGSKTRFGFFGNGEEPPDSGESGAARTVIGHDIHLQKLPSGFAKPSVEASLASLPPTPVSRKPLRSPVLAPMPEAITESVPVRRRYRQQQSRLARFLGRWTTGGNFRSRSRMGDSTILDEPGTDDLDVPRDTTGRNVLLVLVIALLTFLVTFAIVKLRQRWATPQPASGAQVVESRAEPAPLPKTPAPAAPTPVVPTQAALASAHPTTPAPAGKQVLLGTPASAASAPLASPPRPRSQTAPPLSAQAAPTRLPAPGAHPSRRARVEAVGAEPPEHLRGELLPLSP